MSKSKTVKLGKTGLNVHRIGFGGIPIQRLSMEEAERLIRYALDRGINFFDTARGYTDSERKLGQVLSRKRSQVLIASKSFGRDGVSIRRDLETTLRELDTDYIDLYQFHNLASVPDLERVTAPGGALEELVKAREHGKIRLIGITGHKPWIVLKALRLFTFATIQIPFNFMETTALDELIPAARTAGVGIIAMKPIGGGNIQARSANFRFIFQKGIDIAIPGIDQIAQVDDNLSVLEKLRAPTVAEMKALEREKARLGNDFCRRCEYCQPCPQGLPVAFLHVLKNYFYLYDLKDWVLERLAALNKTYDDCTSCRSCVEKCPYHLDSPEVFRRTGEAIHQYQELKRK